MLCVVWLLVDCPWKPLCFFRDIPLFILCCKIVPNLNILRCSIEFGSSLHRLWYDFAMDPLRTKIVVTYTCFWFRSFTKKPLVLLLTHNWLITDLLLTPNSSLNFLRVGIRKIQILSSQRGKNGRKVTSISHLAIEKRVEKYRTTPFFTSSSTMPLNIVCKSLWYWKNVGIFAM